MFVGWAEVCLVIGIRTLMYEGFDMVRKGRKNYALIGKQIDAELPGTFKKN